MTLGEKASWSRASGWHGRVMRVVLYNTLLYKYLHFYDIINDMLLCG